MRLDKFLVHSGILSRREAAKAVRAGKVACDGVTARSPDMQIDPEKTRVEYNKQTVEYSEYTYIMLNKPSGYVSATDDPREKTVLELLPENLRRRGLFPCGRLDKNTVGLLILTNDGETAHKNLSPKWHAEKEYVFECRDDIGDITEMEKGVTLDGGYTTLPCKIRLENERRGVITLCEGKYHQIKRMFETTGNKITYLERISFAGIALDARLSRGEWRYLDEEETEKLKTVSNIKTDVNIR